MLPFNEGKQQIASKPPQGQTRRIAGMRYVARGGMKAEGFGKKGIYQKWLRNTGYRLAKLVVDADVVMITVAYCAYFSDTLPCLWGHVGTLILQKKISTP